MENTNTPQQMNPQNAGQPQNVNTGGQTPLPNATAALVLGIISIPTCICYGIIGLACGIIALILAGKAKKLYDENPSLYTIGSFKNMQAGKVCGIIGVSLSSLYLIYVIVVLAFFGSALTSMWSEMPWDQF